MKGGRGQKERKAKNSDYGAAFFWIAVPFYYIVASGFRLCLWKEGEISMRKCRKCGEEKPLEDFRELSASKDGKNPRCKPCVRDR